MRRSWFWPFVFGAVSLLPRLLLIGRDRLWYDESFTAWMTTLPVGQQVLATTADVHPPLWYLIETLAARLLGTSEIALRLPAALFGAAAVVETYLLIRQITGDREAKWAAGLMAIMPAQIYYSQEARMYTLLTWLVLLAARGILSGRWGRVWPALALILYCHNTGPIYVAILGGAVLVKGGWKTALKVAAPAGLAWLPWLPGLYTQITSMNSSFWLQPSGIGGAVYSFFVTAFYQRTPHLFQAHAAVVCFLMMFITGAVIARDWRKLVMPIVMTFAPMLLELGLSWTVVPVLLPRTLLPSGAFNVGLWGVTLSRLTPRNRRALLAVLGPVLAVTVVNYYATDFRRWTPATGEYDAVIAENWQPGDVILHTSMTSYVNTIPYFSPDDYRMYLVEQEGNLSEGISQACKEMFGVVEIAPDELAATGARRAWIIMTECPFCSERALQETRALIASSEIIEDHVLDANNMSRLEVVLVELGQDNDPDQ